MSNCLLLSQSQTSANALGFWRDVLGYGESGYDMSIDIEEQSDFSCEELYLMIARQLELWLNESTSFRESKLILVDHVSVAKLSAASESTTWENLIAMLILSFPEVYWYFGSVELTTNNPGEFPHEHVLSGGAIFRSRNALFDPTGLREWVRGLTGDHLELIAKKNCELPYSSEGSNAHVEGLPRRELVSAAIDEEDDYAFMHSYTSYRYGFRSDVVLTWRQMKDRFGSAQQECSGGHEYALLMEDMRLSFSDKPLETHISLLGMTQDESGRNHGRSYHCPLLHQRVDNSSWRFLITSGQDNETQKLIIDNKRFLATRGEHHNQPKRGDLLFKPVGGIFDLWDKLGLYHELKDSNRVGNADGFVWPPTSSRGDESVDMHGAPGKLMLIANSMLERAEKLYRDAYTSIGYIRSAILAVDAAELLGGKTPTLTLTALIMKHKSEVRAECAFVGVGYHISLRRRFDELQSEIEFATSRFHSKSGSNTKDNALAIALHWITMAFREAGQHDEENECLVELRKVNRRIATGNAWRSWNPFAIGASYCLGYGEWLLGSFQRLMLLSVFWILLFSAINQMLFANDLFGFEGPANAIATSIGWMFGGSPTMSTQPIRTIVSCIGVLVGAFHVGVLVSYLYSLIARK